MDKKIVKGAEEIVDRLRPSELALVLGTAFMMILISNSLAPSLAPIHTLSDVETYCITFAGSLLFSLGIYFRITIYKTKAQFELAKLKIQSPEEE